MHDVLAKYYTRILTELKAMNISIYRFSLQNEPQYEPSKYPGTKMEPDQQAAIGDIVRPMFDAAGFNDTGIIALDHNWDLEQYGIQVLNASVKDAFVGVAFHCYTAAPGGQKPFQTAYRDAEIHFTECTRITQFSNEPWGNLKSHGQQLLTGTIDTGSSSVILWNAALNVDLDGMTSPTLQDVCKNCLAPILINEDGGYKLTSDFALLAQGSLATRLRKDEVMTYKLGVSTTDGMLLAQAFETVLADGSGNSRYSVVLLQQNDHYLNGLFEEYNCVLKFRDQVLDITFPVGVHTFWFTAPSSFHSQT